MSAVEGPWGPYETEAMAAHDAGILRSEERPQVVAELALAGWLVEACRRSGVGLGEYDVDVLMMLGAQKPAVVQVLVRMITRAHEAGAAGRGEHARGGDGGG